MYSTQDPFLSAEIQYRQLRAVEMYNQRPRGERRHRWVPRRPSLTWPRPRRRPAAVA